MEGTTRPDTATRDRVTRRVRAVTGWVGGLAATLAVGLGMVFAQSTAAAEAAQPPAPEPLLDPVPAVGSELAEPSEPLDAPATTTSRAPRAKSRAPAPRTTAPRSTAPRPPKTSPKPAPQVSGGGVHGSSGSS